MLNLVKRMIAAWSHRPHTSGDGHVCEAEEPEAGRRLQELERKVAEQDELLSGAASFLHQAAYLAHYHQPGLERQIRTFLSQLER